MFSPDKFLVTEIIEAATEPLRAYVPFHPAVKSMSTPDVWSAKISVSFEMMLNPCVIFSCPPVFFLRAAGRSSGRERGQDVFFGGEAPTSFQDVLSRKAGRCRAGRRIVLCGEYLSTCRKVRRRSPHSTAPHRACPRDGDGRCGVRQSNTSSFICERKKNIVILQ